MWIQLFVHNTDFILFNINLIKNVEITINFVKISLRERNIQSPSTDLVLQLQPSTVCLTETQRLMWRSMWFADKPQTLGEQMTQCFLNKYNICGPGQKIFQSVCDTVKPQTDHDRSEVLRFFQMCCLTGTPPRKSR